MIGRTVLAVPDKPLVFHTNVDPKPYKITEIVRYSDGEQYVVVKWDHGQPDDEAIFTVENALGALNEGLWIWEED